MKMMVILIMLISLTAMLSPEEFPKKLDTIIADTTQTSQGNLQQLEREVPDWEWEVAPQELMTNYADYFQTYNAIPVALQPENEGGGVYILYSIKDLSGISELCYSYVDANGYVQVSQSLGYAGYHCDAEVDQLTGDVFICWQGILEEEQYGCNLMYDLYHIMQSHGLWKDPYIEVIDPVNIQNEFILSEDKYISPRIHIGQSPITGKQRIYLIASNYTGSIEPARNPSENVLLCYADFDQYDLDMQSDLEWNYTGIPALDLFHAENPNGGRSQKSSTVIDNQVIFFGYQSYGASNPVDTLFCCINSNYGEGEWEMFKTGWIFEEDNPEFIWDGAKETQYLFGEDAEVYQKIIHTSQFNVIPSDEGNKVSFAGAMGVMFDNGEGLSYYPHYNMIYPKTFNFDLNTHEFSFTDVYPGGNNPHDDIPMKPWDLDEDGEIDEFADNGFPLWVEDYPIFHYDHDKAYSYNQYFITRNEEEDRLALIWVDGTNAAKANEGIEGYESWVDMPEIAVCINYGYDYWSDPIFMNGNPESENYVEELDDLIPCYVYPGDRIEDVGDYYGVIHLLFLDDNDYGSYHHSQQGLNNGSTFQYAALSISFSQPCNLPENELVLVPVIVRNYPNPFNPETTIEFDLQAAGNVKIDVYNIRGQKVCTLADDHYEAGKHDIVWKADEYSSGVYFYKIKHGKYTTSKKMILMK